jgi:hypothetical protein
VDQDLQQAITAISQSDPLIKLLQEVRLGRMPPKAPGLLAITETWLAAYRRVLESGKNFDRRALLRLHPGPRLDVLIQAGIVEADHPALKHLLTTFEQALARAQEMEGGCGTLPP